MPLRPIRTVAVLALIAPLAAAQQALPPVRPLAAAHVRSSELLAAVSQVRALPDGRVLVNDNLGRRVALFDPMLNTAMVVADTTSATANAYSSRAGGLIAYRGDSTLFVDPTSLSMLVIDPRGQIARVMSVPRPNDANSLVGGANGTPGFDAQGRLVFRGGLQITMNNKSPVTGKDGNALPMPNIPDSAAILRIDLETRAVDTVAFIHVNAPRLSMTQKADGGVSVQSITNPMPLVDDWAVTSDGRVAVLRGKEYRIEWIDEHGKVAASSRIPFNWQRLDDSTKAAFIDSTRKAMEALRTQQMARMQAGGAGQPLPVLGDGGGAGGGQMVFRMELKGDGGGGNPPPRGQPQQGGPTKVELPPLQFVAPSELPDYAPPFTAGAARSDLEGNIWVRTSYTNAGGSVYDVINAKGELVDRVLFPPGRVIAGFGKGVVYMGVREGTGVRLEAARTSRVTTQ